MNECTEAKSRILELLDEGSFVELFRQVSKRNTDFPSTTADVPGDGVITGYGTIAGRPVYVYSQDETVLGGSVGEMHAKKIEMLYDMALKVDAPVIGLIASSGIRLEEVTDSLNGVGTLMRKKAEASGVILQMDLLFGSCGGSMAVLAGLSDFVLMEKQASLFVQAPNTLDGNSKEKCDTSSADYRKEQDITVDFTGTKEEIIGYARHLMEMLPHSPNDLSDTDGQDDLNRLTNLPEGTTDARYVAQEIADGHFFLEIKKDYAKDLTIGFARLDGVTVGIIGNSEERISKEGLIKGSSFIQFCDAFGLPIVTLTNAAGFIANIENEKNLVRASSLFVLHLVNASVPKINILLSRVTGTPYLLMNAKSLGADYTFAFCDTKIEIMDAKKASEIVGTTDEETFASYQTALAAARRGYIDAIVERGDLRKHVISTLEMLYTKRNYGAVKDHVSK